MAQGCFQQVPRFSDRSDFWVEVGTQSISPLMWSIESGSLCSAEAIIEARAGGRNERRRSHAHEAEAQRFEMVRLVGGLFQRALYKP